MPSAIDRNKLNLIIRFFDYCGRSLNGCDGASEYYFHAKSTMGQVTAGGDKFRNGKRHMYRTWRKIEKVPLDDDIVDDL